MALHDYWQASETLTGNSIEISMVCWYSM